MQPICLSGVGCRAWRPWGERAERATASGRAWQLPSRFEAQNELWRWIARKDSRRGGRVASRARSIKRSIKRSIGAPWSPE